MRLLQFISLAVVYLQFKLSCNCNQVQGRFLPAGSHKLDSSRDLFEYYRKWKSKPKELTSASVRQDSRQIVPILAPMTDFLPDFRPANPSDAFLPDLGFIADFGTLVTRDFPASPLVRLSRDLFESEQCAQYVSCETSKFSKKHQPLNWIHDFLQDFPFKGDLADRLKIGSEDSVRHDKCGFNCNPLGTLTRGLRMLSLLHEIVRVA